MNIEKIHSIALTVAKYIQLTSNGDKSFESHFVILFDDKLIVYSQSFSDLNEKIAFRNTACLIMKAFNANGCIALNEAWTLPESALRGLSRDQVIDLQRAGISNHPQKIEILAVIGENETHCLCANHDIHRNDDGGIISFKETEAPRFYKKSELDYAEGHFSNCLQFSTDLVVPEIIIETTRAAFSPFIKTVSQIEAQLNRLIN